MNGIEKITARIETDSKAEVAAILAEGQAKAEALAAQFKAQAEAQAKAAAEAGSQAAQRQQERLESAAQMDARKMLLSAKQELLDEAFAAAKKSLLALSDEQYAELLAKLAAKAAKSGREEIVLSARDLERVGALVASKANALIPGGQLTVSRTGADIDGGLILREGNVEVNCAFETQFRVLREEMAAEIAGILFA